jgi:hypothetical protein
MTEIKFMAPGRYFVEVINRVILFRLLYKILLSNFFSVFLGSSMNKKEHL